MASATGSRNILFPNPWKEKLTNGAVGFLDHYPSHPFDVPQQCLMEVLLGLHLDAVELS
jgi:hypothetical protein